MKFFKPLVLLFALAVTILTMPQDSIAQWSNEPSGATLISDYSFSDSIPVGQSVSVGGGWSINNGNATRASDGTAPLSPSFVMQAKYPIGFGGGVGPMTMYHGLPNLKEQYTGFWWKPSDPWQGHPSQVNKIVFLTRNVDGLIYMVMHGSPGGPYYLLTELVYPSSNGHLPNSFGDNPGTRALRGNVNSTLAITLGQWHRIELYTKDSTSPTSQDGIVKFWMDGTLIGNYTTVNSPTGSFVEFQFAPTWGGTGSTKTQDDYYWYDHVHISTGGTPGGNPVTAPAVPTSPLLK